MSQVKGTAFLGAHNFFLQKFGPAGIEKIKGRLSPEDQSLLFEKPVLPVSWVDYGAYTRFQVMADNLFGKSDKQLIVDANAAIARSDTKGLYRIFFTLMTTNMLVKNAPALWKQYYSAGRLAVAFNKPKDITLTLTDIPDIPLHHEFANFGYMSECWRMTGAKNVRASHPLCLARGDTVCALNFTWE
jgi:hypothetical protein